MVRMRSGFPLLKDTDLRTAPTPCLCDQCFEAIQRQTAQQAQAAENNRKRKYVTHLTHTRGEFFRTCLYGIQIAIAFVMGIPCFIYMFVKMILAQRKLSKAKK